jgi:hypothetical protein
VNLAFVIRRLLKKSQLVPISLVGSDRVSAPSRRTLAALQFDCLDDLQSVRQPRAVRAAESAYCQASQTLITQRVPMKFKLMPIGAAMLLLANVGHAGPTIDQYVTFSGFGTLGLVHSDYSQADFIGDVSQPRGAGFSSSWSPTPDSDLGGQANITLTDALSGVVQVLSRDDPNGNFKPDVEWANLKYDFTSDFALRVGRILLPTFQRSEVQNVGYALPWVRIPIEINYTDTATHSDGIDALYRVKTGPVTQNLQVQFGSTRENLPGVEFTSIRANAVVISDTLQFGNSSVQLVYQTYEHTGLPSVRIRLVGAGFTYDPGAWFLTADSNYTQDTYFGDFFAWYVSGGVRLGSFTPYSVFSGTRAPSAGTAGLRSLGDEHTLAAGVRWDFAKNLDTKLQLQQVTIDSLDDPASFANLQSGARVGDKANVLSLTLDFVF